MDNYGHVDGDRPRDVAEATKSDPFEALLGTCRVLGLQYSVTLADYPTAGKLWTASLSWETPGDFFGGSDQRRGRDGSVREAIACGFADRLEALSVAFRMAIGELRQSCSAWRSIVKEDPQYKYWFAPRPPSAPPDGSGR